MKKIISLFQRNYGGDNLVRNEVTPGAEWVVAREGVATQKHDGTSCLWKDGRLFKRYDAKAFTVDRSTGVKHAWDRTPPPEFAPAQDPDPVTGHWPGWVPVGDGPEDKWHREALESTLSIEPHLLVDGGTYELCGPKINGNPERLPRHCLTPHNYAAMPFAPTDFDGLRNFFADPKMDMEGIVWHHADGRMVKIKASDFGFKRHAK